MRVRLELARDGGSITVRVDRYSPSTPPARVAAALGSAVETVLQRLGWPVEPVPALSAPAFLPAPPRTGHRASPAGRVDAGAVQIDAVQIDAVQTDDVVAGEPEREQVSAAADVADVADHIGEGVEDRAGGDDGESRRRMALRLLDEGFTDAEVCARVGISRGRLLRWDDALAGDAHVDQLATVGGLG